MGGSGGGADEDRPKEADGGVDVLMPGGEDEEETGLPSREPLPW